MQDKEMFFVIPTYRVRDVNETIELYDEHFWRNGHSVQMLGKSFDILASFLDVLGKPAAQVPANYERGELLVDTATDLETNATKGLAREHPSRGSACSPASRARNVPVASLGRSLALSRSPAGASARSPRPRRATTPWPTTTAPSGPMTTA
jgi:hypothetical protein